MFVGFLDNFGLDFSVKVLDFLVKVLDFLVTMLLGR